MAQSSEVNAGDDILATQYNNLRKDVLDAALGHKHTGKTDEGATVGSPLFPKEEDLVGDGSDGDLTVNAPTEITEPKQFDNLTLNDALTMPAGRHFMVIRVKGTLTINSGGILDMKGKGGAGGAAPGANNPGIAGDDGFISELKSLPGETEAGALNGGDGLKAMARIAAVTDAGDDIFMGYGAGGGSSGSFAGSVARNGGPGGDIWAGGGGGGGPSSAAGEDEAGGNGGGCLIVLANAIVINSGGIIRADGEDGLDGGANENGGGGGGGLAYVAYRTLANSGTITAAKGLGGQDGNPGGDGADGLVVEKIIPG